MTTNPYSDSKFPQDTGDPFTPQHELVKQVAAWWHHTRQDRTMPKKCEVDPIAFPKALPYIWLVSWEPTQNAYVYRLAGDEIRHLFPLPMRGHTTYEIFGQVSGYRVERIFHHILSKPAFLHRIGKIYDGYGREGRGERIALPLSDNQGKPRHVLGLSIYTLHPVASAAPFDDASYHHNLSSGVFHSLEAIRAHQEK